MAIIIGGHELGLQDGSFALLNRNDRTGAEDPGHGEQIFVNVSNGNLIVRQEDAFLPSQGEDFTLVRTYNSRGEFKDFKEIKKAGWTLSVRAQLYRHQHEGEGPGSKKVDAFEVIYGDGTALDFSLDKARGLWVSTDGAGAYETLSAIDYGNKNPTKEQPAYVVTRADQTQYFFNRYGDLLSTEDTNGVRMEFDYKSNRLQRVVDDQGHVIEYQYDGSRLVRIVDELGNRLVEYRYENNRLAEVIDRHGHSTEYYYTSSGSKGKLERIVLPDAQTVDGQTQQTERREIRFEYVEVDWKDKYYHGHKSFEQGNKTPVLSRIIDAEGGVTTFQYDFRFADTPAAGDRDIGRDQPKTKEFFIGVTTTVVDALGNSMRYTADEDGYLTEVVDQQGNRTTYRYDERDNLIAVTDRNGWGASNSDSEYYLALRAELGYVDAAGNGKRVADLSQAEKDALHETFTSRFTYDERGNLLTSADNEGNVTSFTYTAFNKPATTTSPVGHALITSDSSQYLELRKTLGFVDPADAGKGRAVADLTDGEKDALLALYTTTFEYDARQNLVKQTDPGGDVTLFRYDANGNRTHQIVLLDPSAESDPLGAANADKVQVTEFRYDQFGNNIETVDAEGNHSFSLFDHFGNLVQFTDGNGGITTFTYDNDDRLLTATDPEGHTTINSYDAVGNRISVTDARGHTVTRIFDLNNRLIATLDPSETSGDRSRLSTNRYDVVGNLTESTDAEGRVTRYVYDARRQLVAVILPEVAGADGSTLTQYRTTFAYDGETNLVRTTDNNGNPTRLLYTPNGLVREQTDANGQVTRFTYDGNNNQLRIIAGAQLPPAKRQILSFGYDEEDQLIRATDAEGGVTVFDYDAPGNVVSLTDANGNQTRFEYDRNDRVLKEILPESDPAGQPYTIEHRYDANGNEVETVDENGNSTRFVFDKDDKLVMVTDGNGINTVFTYDSRENRTSVQIGVAAHVENGHRVVVDDVTNAQVTSFLYDEFNQLIGQVDGVGNALAASDLTLYQELREELGQPREAANLSEAIREALRERYTTEFSYDRVGNQLSISDNEDRVTAFRYDALDRLVSETDALDGVSRLTYDGNANPITATDALGRVTRFEYDEVDRLIRSTDPTGVSTRFEYDDFGNLTQETKAADGPIDQRRTTTWNYDLNNRIVQTVDPEGHRLRFEYDPVGNRIREIDGRGGQTDFIYDALDRNVRILDPLTLETKIEYDGVGNQIALTDPKGGITRFNYDAGNRQIGITDAEGRETTFAYDVRGNVTVQTTGAQGSGSGAQGPEITRFEYDAENNLRAVVDAQGNRSTTGFDRVYNPIATTDGNGHTTLAEFDALNRNIQITDPLGGTTRLSYDAVGNQLSLTDALGRVRTFAYDGNDRVIVETGPDGVETRFGYDAVGNQVAVTQAANRPAEARTSTFRYDRDDRLVEQTDPLGATTRFEYDANDNVIALTNANGSMSNFEYDANNQLIRAIDPLGNATSFGYDENGNRARVIDANGNLTRTFYNRNDEVVLSVDALGFATAITYDANGNIASETRHILPVIEPVLAADPLASLTPSPGDRTTRFEYDELNRLIRSIDALGGIQAFTYDAVGNALSETDENGNATSFVYDDNDRLIIRTNALGEQRSFAYDAVGNQTGETDENGHTTHFAYDVNDRLVSQTDPLAGVRGFGYDAVGNQIAETDENGNTTSFAYDANDRLVSRTDPLGGVRSLVYDAVGNLVEQTDENGNTTRFEYDANNQLIRQTDPLGDTRTLTYDAVGNQLSETDENGNTNTFTYDALDRVISLTDAESGVRTVAYDAVGNQIEETDEVGNTTRFEYDANDRLVSRTDPLGGVRGFAYDAVGNRIAETDENGHTTTFAYDALNRQVRETDPLGGIRSFTYDAVGNQLSETDENGNAFVVEYDANDRRVAELTAQGFLTTLVYDKVGNVLIRSEYKPRYVLNPDGSIPDPAASDPRRVTTSIYDANNRLISQTDAEGVTTVFTYDAAGNVTNRDQNATPPSVFTLAAASSGRGQERRLDARNRVEEEVDALGVVTRFTRDKAGNVIERIDDFGGSAERVTTFEYDKKDRMIRTTDALGNALVSSDAPEHAALRSTLFGITSAADQLTKIEKDTILDAFSTEFAYDRADRMLTRTSNIGQPGGRVERFEYDANGQLTAQVNGEGERTTFTYDAAGNRTGITVAPGLPEERVNRFEYDADNRLAAEVDGNGVRTEFRYDEAGNKIETIQAVGIAGEERHTLYDYNADNQLVSVTSPTGNTTTYEYDDSGNQFRITDADGTVTENEFDDNGRITQNIVGVNGPRGGIKTVNVFDEFGNLTSSTLSYADGTDARTTTYEYDDLDRQTVITDADGFSTVIAYDAFGNQSRVITGAYLPQPTDADYDAAKAALARPLESRFVYDEMNRLLRTTDGEGNAVESVYDALGNRISQTDGIATAASDDPDQSATETFFYDLAGRLVEKRNAEGGVVQIRYDEAGNQTELRTLQSGTPASSPVWVTQSYAYDGNGRVVEERDSFGTVTEFQYDAVGNTTAVVSAKGTADERTVGARYDLDNNQIARFDAIGHVQGYETTIAVDAFGNPVTETDPEGNVTRFYYDAFHRLVGQVDPENFYTRFVNGSAGNVVETHVFMTPVAVPADGSPPADPAGEVRVTTRTFNGVGKRVREDFANGSFVDYVFDSASRLIERTTHPSTEADEVGRTEDLTPRTIRWEYDLAGRLTRYVSENGTEERFSYDAANNTLTETVHNPNPLSESRVDPDRTTVFTYDLANRLSSQTNGSRVQSFTYDKAGNVLTKTDAGATTTSGYDENNRLTSVSDPLGNVIRYEYDLIGNRTRLTDARGNATDLTYDLNNRLVREQAPSVQTFTIEGAFATLRPTTTTVYDRLGNVVEVTGRNGFKTTNWYDGNSRLIASLDGDFALSRFAYDATGALASLTRHVDRIPDVAASRDLSQPPTGTTNTDTIVNHFDKLGRVVQTEYPPTDVTQIVGADTSNPTTTLVRDFVPTEQSLYDAFGNLVESVDRNGNRSYGYYDLLGRQVASVDAGGYLLESDYDAQGNVVQQRKYAVPLGPVSADVRPTAPLGEVFKVDRIYDAEGRLTNEISPRVHTQSGDQRVTTRFAYDAAGNVTGKTLAFGTPEAQTEFRYYDAANRLVALVNNNRVLHVFSYDENGNLIRQSRFINLVPASVDLSAASFDSLAVSEHALDETIIYQYDAVNLLATQTDLMGPGTSDNLVQRFFYDPDSNLTRKVDADRFVSQNAYDAAKHIVQTISPNGGQSFVEYNTAGLKVRAWTGGAPGQQAPLPTNVAASVANGARADLTVSWDVTGAGVTTWVAWDTVSHTIPDGSVPARTPGTHANSDVYANSSGAAGSGTGQSVVVPLTFDSGAVYFRVMSLDSSGNLAWTEEKSVTLPPRIRGMEIIKSGSDFDVVVTFSAAVSGTPQLVPESGAPVDGSASGQPANTFKFTLTNPTDPAGLSFRIAWSDGANDFVSDSGTFLRAPGDHAPIGGEGVVGWPVPSVSGAIVGDTQLIILDGVAQPDAAALRVDAGDFTELQFDPNVTTGTHVYDVFYGTRRTESHTVSVEFADTQVESFTFSHYLDKDGMFTIDPTKAVQSVWTRTWVSDANNTVTTTVSADLGAELANVGIGGLKVAYRLQGSGADFDAVADMTGTTVRSAVLELLQSTTYDLKVFYLDGNGDEVIVEWQRVTVPAEAADASGGQVTVNGTGAPASASRSVDVGTPQSFSGNSLTVRASETNGRIDFPLGELRVTAGVYDGPVEVAQTSVALGVGDDDVPGNKSISGLDGSNFTEIEYNPLGVKIASNEDTGIWRRLGVDANGNVIETRAYGTKENEEDFLASVPGALAPIVTHKAYDARNQEIADFGAGISQRPVTRTTYDYAGQVKTVREPGVSVDREFAYDGVGNLVREAYAGAGIEVGGGLRVTEVRSRDYDRLGNLVAETDANGHTRNRVYGSASDTDPTRRGRLVAEYITGLSNETVTYGYDAFGRVTSVTDGLGNRQTMSYDQRGRLVAFVDPIGNSTSSTTDGITRYYYDGRDNQIWVQDANGNFFGRAYNEMGLVTNEYSFQTRWRGVDLTAFPFNLAAPTTLNEAIAIVNSPNLLLVNVRTEYDVFNNKVAEIDAEGRRRNFTYEKFGRVASDSFLNLTTSFQYDPFGRPVRETSNIGKLITRNYDAAGRLEQVNDVRTATRTDYTYDIAGRRRSEILRISNGVFRNETYDYYENGWLKKWKDFASSPDIELNYQYDAKGNRTRVSGSGALVDTYTYDAADRLRALDNKSYTYDNAGQRKTYFDGSATTTYFYDRNGQVTAARGGQVIDWIYDAVGNVTKVTSGGKSVQNFYDTNYLNWKTIDDDQTIVTRFDRSARILSTSVTDNSKPSEPKTYTYTYNYSGFDGLQTSVSGGGTGDVSGNSSTSYNINREVREVNLGKGDESERNAIKRFTYDNDGFIVSRFDDDGENDTGPAVTTRYLYANGDPVGEYTNASSPILNSGNYTELKNIDDDPAFPESAISQYTVTAGDTLQSVAGQFYGNPNLWFVIAEANGLSGSDPLQAGSRLVIPNTVENGRLTFETHALYKEGDIIGSKLPNLKSPPPPPKDDCAVITAIILIVVIAIAAVVLTVVTVGAAAPAAAAALGLAATSVGGIIVGVVVGAAIGAAIAFAASVATQGILVGFGLQEEFDWNQVAADTVIGAFGGAAAGVGALVSAARAASTTVKVLNVVGQAALEAAGETASQAIQNDGKISNPGAIAIAGVTGGFGAALSEGLRASKGALNAASRTASKADDLSGAARKSISRARKFLVGTGPDPAALKKLASLKSGATKFAQAAKAAPGKTFSAARAAPGRIVAAAKAAPGKIVAAAKAIPGKLSGAKRAAGEALSRVTRTASEAIGAARTATADALRAARSAVSKASRAAQAAVKGAAEAAINAAQSAAKRAIQAAAEGAAKVAAVAGRGFDAARGATGKIVTAVRAAPGRIVAAARAAAPGRIVAAAKAIPGKVLAAARSAAREALSRASRTAREVIGAAKTATAAAVDTARSVVSKALEKAFQTAGRAAESGIQTARRGIGAARRGAEAATERLQGGLRRLGEIISRKEGTITKFDNLKLVKRFETVTDEAGNVTRKLRTVSVLRKSKEGTKLREAIDLGKFGFVAGKIGEAKKQSAKAVLAGITEQFEKETEGQTRDAGSKSVVSAALKGLILPGGELSADPITRAAAAPDRVFEKPGPSFDDQNARSTFADLHAQQHSWRQIGWQDVAAETTTAIYSPYDLDRAPELELRLNANRMVSGQVAGFDDDQILAFAERSVGAVRGNVDTAPVTIPLLTPLPPDPRVA